MVKHVSTNAYMPECPERIIAVEASLKGVSMHQALKDYATLRKVPSMKAQPSSVWSQCSTVEVKDPMDDRTICEAYGTRFVQHAHSMLPGTGKASRIDPVCSDVYWSHGTWTAARIAAAAAVRAAQAALTKGESAFCVVRPPGHHCFDSPAGFCILNNVVLAAQEVLRAGKRVAVVDWDYHFGDGTANALQSERNAMFVSFHAAKTGDDSPTYPLNTRDDLKGKGLCQKTDGRCFNIQWDIDNADDAAMAYAFDTLLLPALQTFRPDILLISAGFDAVRGDALAGMDILPPAFGFMARRLVETLKGIPIVAVLEGGYDTFLLAECVTHTVRGMLGDAAYTWSRWKHEEVRYEHRRIVDETVNILVDLKVLGGR